MLVTLLFLTLLSFGAGFAANKHLRLKQLHSRPEPPLLDTPEQVLSYLEACSLDQNNPEMNEMFGEFRLFVNGNQQLALPGVSTAKPKWFHNPDIDPSCEEHWQVFLTDLKRETDPKARVDVVKHWITDLGNGFTYKEIEMILDHFEDSADRAAVRQIFAGKRKEARKTKRKSGNPGVV